MTTVDMSIKSVLQAFGPCQDAGTKCWVGSNKQFPNPCSYLLVTFIPSLIWPNFPGVLDIPLVFPCDKYGKQRGRKV